MKNHKECLIAGIRGRMARLIERYHAKGDYSPWSVTLDKLAVLLTWVHELKAAK